MSSILCQLRGNSCGFHPEKEKEGHGQSRWETTGRTSDKQSPTPCAVQALVSVLETCYNHQRIATMESHHQSTTTTTVYRTLPHIDLFAETVGLPGLNLTEAALERCEPDQTALLSGPAYYAVLSTEPAVYTSPSAVSSQHSCSPDLPLTGNPLESDRVQLLARISGAAIAIRDGQLAPSPPSSGAMRASALGKSGGFSCLWRNVVHPVIIALPDADRRLCCLLLPLTGQNQNGMPLPLDTIVSWMPSLSLG
ncbi:hypothetical protein CSIM01_07745 [Colletotrichum simmondsii]|uniref:Uncharacterized protein n=1 Tax=Colletotrichum simmondsii TaxID=703756 RepID=A0A135SV51_9PEZI|nr:hypothetical protein CSIM01_07745 [Colletotrichum simmondsii]